MLACPYLEGFGCVSKCSKTLIWRHCLGKSLKTFVQRAEFACQQERHGDEQDIAQFWTSKVSQDDQERREIHCH